MKITKQYLIFFILSIFSIGCNHSKTTTSVAQKSDSAIKVITTIPIKPVPQTSSAVETIKIDLNDDGRADTIELKGSPTENNPGGFLNAHIALTNFSAQVLDVKGVWDKIDTGFLKLNTNAIKSNNVFVYKKTGNVIIMLFGYEYGAGREQFTIIQVKENTVKLVFDGELEFPIKFMDINNDGKPEFIALKSHSEVYEVLDSLDADIVTYDPYSIYNIEPTFKENKLLTKKYNLENYVWMGEHPPRDVKLFVPRNGDKPHIVK